MRVVIAEDSVLLREGASRLLGEADMDVVGYCETAEELMLKVRSYSLDVAIVDIRLPPTHSDERLRRQRSRSARNHPEVSVLVLSQYVEVGLAMTLLADSADGRRLLAQGPDQRGRRVHRARCAGSPTGGSAIDPIIVSTLLSRTPGRRSTGAA